MKRRLSKLCFIASVVLLFAVLAIWIRGLFIYDYVVIPTSSGRLWILSFGNHRADIGVVPDWRGGDRVRWRSFRLSDLNPATRQTVQDTDSGVTYPVLLRSWSQFDLAGLSYGRRAARTIERPDGCYVLWFLADNPTPAGAGSPQLSPPLTCPTLRVPFWLLALIVGAMPLYRVARYCHSAIVGARRRGQGYCPTCGYDLRATPERCPECGQLITPSKGGV